MYQESITDRYSGQSGQFQNLQEQGQEGALKSVEGWILFVTGIHEEAQEEDIHDAFSQFGKLKNLHLNLDRRTGYVKGYTLVEFDEYEDAKAAIDQMDGQQILEKPISVNWAFKYPPKGSNKDSRRR